ncbi:guanitoxin biosynthesis heme-dependent pre-guanitoxin N-hydroxylase GntA [soil metagenome]
MRVPETSDIDVGTEPAAVGEFVRDAFRSLVMNPRFSCVAAKSAFRRDNYRHGVYGAMGCPASPAALARDLESFVADASTFKPGFRTFVASFDDTTARDEKEFERALWRVLQSLHDIDRQSHEWDPTVSSDPADPEFSFSFAGTAFFLVGMHPTSSRMTRRFAWPTMVFNLHAQFEDLRREGRYERMQHVIRERDVELQGSIHPNLADFGERSEARQYAGRVTEEAWKCPFSTRAPKRPRAK